MAEDNTLFQLCTALSTIRTAALHLYTGKMMLPPPKYDAPVAFKVLLSRVDLEKPAVNSMLESGFYFDSRIVAECKIDLMV